MINIRKGFDRFGKLLLLLIWAFALFSFGGQGLEAFGYTVGFMLMFTVAYMVFCKLVAWVFNGFFPAKPD